MSIIRTRNSGLGMRNGAFLKNELELLSLQNPHKKQSSITVNEIHQDGASFGTQRLAYKFWHWPSDQYITCSRWGSGRQCSGRTEFRRQRYDLALNPNLLGCYPIHHFPSLSLPILYVDLDAYTHKI
ncbi:Protein of unknown function [Pyronema omphalodes CBS 100304]|uniref:Uncharacterized protein n=1 Tax=Pyronema omphalodes (strain CBS 100304) TaxID=1076935 RepID=U4L0Q1_PYROM|nr:Protein of unknown function [Pyronema omphalodes CBS 100304]